MELAEAVRIVREEMIPGYQNCPWRTALVTVLGALEQAEVARLGAQWDAGVLAGMRATAEQQGQIVALRAEVERLTLACLDLVDPERDTAPAEEEKP